MQWRCKVSLVTFTYFTASLSLPRPPLHFNPCCYCCLPAVGNLIAPSHSYRASQLASIVCCCCGFNHLLCRWPTSKWRYHSPLSFLGLRNCWTNGWSSCWLLLHWNECPAAASGWSVERSFTFVMCLDNYYKNIERVVSVFLYKETRRGWEDDSLVLNCARRGGL